MSPQPPVEGEGDRWGPKGGDRGGHRRVSKEKRGQGSRKGKEVDVVFM